MAEQAAEQEEDKAPPVSTEPVSMGDRFRIFPDRPLKSLSVPSTQAFEVQDRRDPKRAVFAMVCQPQLPPRTSSMAMLKGHKVPGALPLVEWNVVDWPPFGQRTLATIYETPKGGRLSDVAATKDGRINEYDIPRKVIEPLATAIQGLSSFGVTHRAIRPDNVFYLDEERTELVLGDCLTTPPGYDQPMVFEPIERSMCSRAGRGKGNSGDDLYAFGVTLVLLMLGHNPVSRLKPDEILATKIEVGTYATLCGRERVPVSMLEPLRGMLSDDPAERWGIEQLDLWVSGRRMTPIQKKPAVKAEVAFKFGDGEHPTARTLAYAFFQNIADAARTLKDPGFDLWLRRSLKDVDLADTIQKFVDHAKVNANNYHGSDDMLVARATTYLDPAGPIRYKKLAFLPEAFGPLMAEQCLRRNNVQTVAEILSRDIAAIWFSAQKTYNPEFSALDKMFSQLKGFLSINDPGYGIERCLYELNPSLPCQSPWVINDYVVDIKDLLPSLEKAAKSADAGAEPMDRHLAAFIAARFPQDIEPHLRAIADPSEEKHIIGVLSLLAFLQWRQKHPALNTLAALFGPLLAPAVTGYHSRTTRRELEREIPLKVRHGSLPELFDLVDNAERRAADQDGFRRAVTEFMQAEVEVQKVEASDTSRAETAVRLGQQAAATTSIVVMFIVACVLFLMRIF